MMKNLSKIVRLEKLQVENHFFEMLTATVSHDMRTPINAIIGLVGNLESTITDENALRFIRIIKNSSGFLMFLVNDLLDFFQIRHGKFKKNIKETNLKDELI